MEPNVEQRCTSHPHDENAWNASRLALAVLELDLQLGEHCFPRPARLTESGTKRRDA